MINSMTGYGQGWAEDGPTAFKVEIRSVNNRFREVTVKLPRALMALEEPVKRLVAERVARGRVEVFIRLEGESPWQKLDVNLPLARQYAEALRELKSELDLAGEPGLGMVASFRDVVGMTDQAPDMDQVGPLLTGVVEEALDGLLEMRGAEGQRLVDDLTQRLDTLAAFVEKVEGEMPALVVAAGQRLRERLEDLIEGRALDPERLAQETAILADKSDVTEELVRLKSHLEQCREILAAGGPVGRKLDFLAQEVYREINTIGSKSGDSAISSQVIEAKAEQERIREQIQNLE